MTDRRPFTAPGDLRAMQRLAQELWRRRPELVDTTVAELAWTAASGSGDWSRRLWLDGGEVVAWGWLFPPAELAWQAHPDRSELLDDVLDWFESEAGAGERRTTVRSADEAAVERLRRRGYEHDPEAPYFLKTARSLEQVQQPAVPDGFRLKTMADGVDVATRVAVHRAAWEPSQLTQERYARVRETWPYRAELDVVLEAPGGTLAASVLAWYDDENRVGEFEPVGTHPDYRRRGLGRATNLFALHLLREAGAERAIVTCRGDAGYPLPKLLYESVGFCELSRQLPLVQRAKG